MSEKTMAKPKRRKTVTAVFQVTIRVPPGANMQDAQEYIRQAVNGYGVEQSDPFFNIQPEHTKVFLKSQHVDYTDPDAGEYPGKPSKSPTRGQSQHSRTQSDAARGTGGGKDNITPLPRREGN